jgi:type VI secretion system FHA domain protein
MSPREAPLHQKADSWSDLDSALQAFCRGAGLEPGSLSAEARAVLPLLAGQLLRELVVGVADVAQGRGSPARDGTPGASANKGALAALSDARQSLPRLLESHGRIQGGAVETLREALRDIKDHETATHSATAAALRALIEQLDPARLEQQFDQGRTAKPVPGIDVRAQYWEHYRKLYQLLRQRMGSGFPPAFAEAFEQAYSAARADLKNRNGGGRKPG